MLFRSAAPQKRRFEPGEGKLASEGVQAGQWGGGSFCVRAPLMPQGVEHVLPPLDIYRVNLSEETSDAARRSALSARRPQRQANPVVLARP